MVVLAGLAMFVMSVVFLLRGRPVPLDVPVFTEAVAAAVQGIEVPEGDAVQSWESVLESFVGQAVKVTTLGQRL